MASQDIRAVWSWHAHLPVVGVFRKLATERVIPDSATCTLL